MSDTTAEDADIDLQMRHVCADPDDRDHTFCPCIVRHARDVMKHFTGTNCTWVDDDITALGILANEAIKAGLYKTAPIPQTMIAEIEKKVSVEAVDIGDDA
jgi:hypothetical protein